MFASMDRLSLWEPLSLLSRTHRLLQEIELLRISFSSTLLAFVHVTFSILSSVCMTELCFVLTRQNCQCHLSSRRIRRRSLSFAVRRGWRSVDAVDSDCVTTMLAQL